MKLNTASSCRFSLSCFLQRLNKVNVKVKDASSNAMKAELSIYRMSRGECARLRENVPYVKVHRSSPKHLYPKLNSYGDNGDRKVWGSCGSTYCTCFAFC